VIQSVQNDFMAQGYLNRNWWNSQGLPQ